MNFRSRYDGPGAGTTTAYNGAIASVEFPARVLSGARAIPNTVHITDRVHSFMGGSIINRTFIQTESGVIVYDTGEDYEDGVQALAALREITDKPVLAIIYSHNHYVHGTLPFIEEGNDPIIIGHRQVNANLQSGTTDATDFAEATPVLRQRMMQQFAEYLPTEGPDAALGSTYAAAARSGAVAVTREVQHGEELVIDGLRLQFFTDHISDSDDTLTAWVPELSVALNNFLWPGIPNFYALRGSGFRDPRSWRDGVLILRNLQPDHLLSTHARPISGKELIASTLESYADAISFMFDQALRGIIQGQGPNGLRDFVQLPDYLRENPHNSEGYGEVQYQTPYIYTHTFGWYDERPELINPAPVQLKGQRIVEGFGGKDAVLAAIDKAIEDQENTWAAELAGLLHDSDPEDPDARAAKAQTLRILAHRSPGSIARHFYLAHVLQLEGKITIPPALAISPEEVLRQSPGMFLNYQRIRLDPAKSGRSDTYVTIRLSDRGIEHGLHVRSAVCEFVPDPNTHPREPDIRAALNHQTWAQLYCGHTTWAEAIERGDVEVDGDASELITFFGLFDDAVPQVSQ